MIWYEVKSFVFNLMSLFSIGVTIFEFYFGYALHRFQRWLMLDEKFQTDSENIQLPT